MENRTASPAIPGAVDLGPDAPGYQLRMLNRVVEPGKAIAMHSHEKRPGLTYVLEGTLTEVTEDGTVHEYHAGDVIAESRATVHSAENRGTTRLVLLGAHMIKKQLD